MSSRWPRAAAAVERQRRIGFGEMVVAADLDRPVAGVGDGQDGARQAGVQFDVAWLGKEFTGDHPGVL